MQILPTPDSGNAPDGYLPLLERSVSPAQPFSDVMNRLIDKAREQKSEDGGDIATRHQKKTSAVKQDSKAKTKSEVSSKKQGTQSESAIPSDITVDREALAEIKNKLKEYGMSDESISEITDEISSEGEISWKRLQKIISNKLELSDENFDPELTQQEQTELLSFFQKLNFTVDQSNRLLEAISGSDQAEDAWALIKKHINALSDDSLQSVTKSEVSVLGKALGVSGSTQLTEALMGQSGTGSADGGKVKNALNLLFQQADVQSSFLSEKAAALRDILHTGLRAATKRGENSMLADNRSSKDVDNAKVRIEDGAEKKYGEKKTTLGEENTSNTATTANSKKSDAPVTQNKAYETESETKRKNSQEKTAGLPEQVGKPSSTAQDSMDKLSEKASTGIVDEKAKTIPVADEGSAKNSKNSLTQKDAGEGASAKSDTSQKSAVVPGDSSSELDTGSEDSQEKTGDGSKDPAGDKNELFASNNKKSSEKISESDAETTKTETEKAWEKLLEKVEVEEGSVLQTNGSQQTNASSNSAANAKEEISAARIMRTVETGVLNNTGQGRTQLTIRLDPPSLGQLTVSLQVKHDEVQAIIKTDSEEVGKMISDHLNLLRHSLEQHGLKVEKLDVQTQTQNNDGKGWQSAEQHNQAQQQSQRDQQRTSLRTLQNLAMQGESLSQDVLEETPVTSTNIDGLHLIA